jgi:hypothetical protein
MNHVGLRFPELMKTIRLVLKPIAVHDRKAVGFDTGIYIVIEEYR